MSLVRTIGEIEGRCKFLLNLPIRNIAQNQSLGLKILREDIRHYKA